MFVVLQEPSLSYDHSQHINICQHYQLMFNFARLLTAALVFRWMVSWAEHPKRMHGTRPGHDFGVSVANVCSVELCSFDLRFAECSRLRRFLSSTCDPHVTHIYIPILHPCVSCVGDYCNTGSQALTYYMRSCNSCSPVPCSQATNNLEALFEDEPVRPVLLHGDFWNGNFAGAPHGSKWI